MRPRGEVVQRPASGQPRQAAPKVAVRLVVRVHGVTPFGQVEGAGRSVVGEVVDGEPARHCRPERPWLEDRRPFPLVEGGEHVAGGVGGVTEHLHLAGLLVDGGIGADQVRPDGGGRCCPALRSWSAGLR